MLILLLALVISSAASTTVVSSAADTTYVYSGCTQQKYTTSSSRYQSSLNTLLTTLVNAATSNTYTNFTVAAASTPTAYGLFQCRGDLYSACFACVSTAVSQLAVLCPDSYGAALQLEGCLVKYDSAPFVGVEDKSEVLKRCGPMDYGTEFGPNEQVLEYLASGAGFYRVGQAGSIKGVAQCVGDLSVGECQDCLTDAMGRLRTNCGDASWGDVFLVKCYARFSGSAGHARTPGSGGETDTNDTNSNDSEIQKHLAIIILIIVAVALFVICFSCSARHCDKKSHECK